MPLVQNVDARTPAAPSSAAGDAALIALVQQHQAMVWRYLRLLGADPHEADDLMQDAFVVAAERLRRGERLREPAPFLRVTARNLLLGARRRARRQPPSVPWADDVDRFVGADEGVLEDRRLDLLRACFERLSGRMREAVARHHMDGAPCKDVAEQLGVGANGVKSLLQRARAALRDCVEDKLREESSS